MSASGVDIHRLLQALSVRTVSFLHDELDIEVTAQAQHLTTCKSSTSST
jgi:hypothetical protein